MKNNLAVRVGFEPTVPVKVRQFSRLLDSTSSRTSPFPSKVAYFSSQAQIALRVSGCPAGLNRKSKSPFSSAAVVPASCQKADLPTLRSGLPSRTQLAALPLRLPSRSPCNPVLSTAPAPHESISLRRRRTRRGTAPVTPKAAPKPRCSQVRPWFDCTAQLIAIGPSALGNLPEFTHESVVFFEDDFTAIQT